MSTEPAAGRSPEADQGTVDARFAAELRAALTTARAADALTAPSPPDRLLDLLVRTAARAIPSPEGALFLADPARRVLTFAVAIGTTADRVTDLTVPLGRGIAGLVAVSGQPLAIANAKDDPRHAREIAELAGYLPTTILAVPVVASDGTVLGVLELLDRQGQPTYDLRDMELLGAFAEQAALLLDQRRAHATIAALIGRALAALGGLPSDIESDVAMRAAGFASTVEADPTARRAVELAELVAAIAAGGPAAHRAGLGVLTALADFVRARPGGAPGLEGEFLR